MAIREVKYSGKIYKISYEVINNQFSDYILIIHGWGANKEIMIKAFSKHFKNIKQIYIDLPGFGKSSIHTPLNTKEYKNIVENFIKSLKTKPKIVMGHSFGGKVATLLEPENLVLLSTAGIVEKKPIMVRFKIAIFKIFKVLGFSKLYTLFATKDVAGMDRVMYETLKNVVNEDFKGIFAKYEGNALIFWGESDKAVSLKSGELIHRLIKKSEFYPLSGDHFFFLLHSKFIAEKIDENIKNTDFKPSYTQAFDELDEISEVGEVYTRKPKKKDKNTMQTNIEKNIDNKDLLKEEKSNILKKNISNEFKYDKKITVKEFSYNSDKDSLEEDIELAIKNAEANNIKNNFIKNPMDKYKNLDEISEVGEVYTRKPKKKDENTKQIDIEKNIGDKDVKEETDKKTKSSNENLEIKDDINSSNEKLEKKSIKDTKKEENQIKDIKEKQTYQANQEKLFKKELSSNEKEIVKEEKNIGDKDVAKEKTDKKTKSPNENLEIKDDINSSNEKLEKESIEEIKNKEKLDNNEVKNSDKKELENRPKIKSFTEIYKERQMKFAKIKNKKSEN